MGLILQNLKLEQKNLTIKNIDYNCVGVRGRNSDNKLIKKMLNWEPNYPLEKGIEKTYQWITEEINKINN